MLSLLLILQTVDPRIAHQILEQTRLIEHVSLLEEHYNIQCSLPDPEHMQAEIECVGTGDFASCFYTFPVPCVGGQPQDLKIRAERTQLGPILDLNITANFRS